MVHHEYTDEDICQVDYFVKSRLTKDVILLAKKSKQAVIETTQFGTLTKIHPENHVVQTAETDVDIYNIVLKLRQIFYAITPIKNKATMTSQIFDKLYNKFVIKSTGLQKIDMSLAFQQATGGNQGPRFVNFLGFCHLMNSFYTKKMVGQTGYGGSFETFVEGCL